MIHVEDWTVPVSRPQAKRVIYTRIGTDHNHEPPARLVQIRYRATRIVGQLDDENRALFMNDLETSRDSDIEFLLHEWEETIAFEHGSPNVVVALERSLESNGRS